jgi:hypothetical protein
MSAFDTEAGLYFKWQLRKAFRLACSNGFVTKYSLYISAMQHTMTVMLMFSRRCSMPLPFPALYLHALQCPYQKTTVKM